MTGSDSLRAWATRELKGYSGDDELPPYRIVPAPLQFDGFVSGGIAKHYTVPALLIPEFARDKLAEGVPFRQGVGEIHLLIESARRRSRDTLDLAPYMSAELVALMNHELRDTSQQIERIYWSVSTAVVAGILDVVRTTLVELVAEMRAGTPAGSALPSRDVTEQAVNVAVRGIGNRVVVQNVRDHGQAAAATKGLASIGAPGESRSRRLTYWVFGIATLLGTGLGIWAIVVK